MSLLLLFFGEGPPPFRPSSSRSWSLFLLPALLPLPLLSLPPPAPPLRLPLALDRPDFKDTRRNARMTCSFRLTPDTITRRVCKLFLNKKNVQPCHKVKVSVKITRASLPYDKPHTSKKSNLVMGHQSSFCTLKCAGQNSTTF